MARRLLALAALTLALLPSAPAAARMQRMVLAPGCYKLAPRQACDADAFCLDRDMPTPAAGATLSNAPAALGDADVRVDGGPPLPLQAALDRHLVEIAGVGADDHVHLKLANLAAAPIELCARRPTVVTENRGDPVADLAALYPRIGELAGTPAARGDDPRQEALWRTVEESTHGAGTAAGATVTDAIGAGCGGAPRTAVVCLAPRR